MWRSGTETGSHCGVGSYPERVNSLYGPALVTRQSTMLRSIIHHAMSQKLGGKWETKRLYIRFPLLTVLYGKYNVNEKKIELIIIVFSQKLGYG